MNIYDKDDISARLLCDMGIRQDGRTYVYTYWHSGRNIPFFPSVILIIISITQRAAESRAFYLARINSMVRS